MEFYVVTYGADALKVAELCIYNLKTHCAVMVPAAMAPQVSCHVLPYDN